MKPTPAISPVISLGLLSGLIGGLLLVLLLMRYFWADPTPQMTLEAYLSALERWNDEAPASYDVQVQVRGTQPATYYVQVREGEARSAFRNERYLPQLRSHETWSVDGMFATLGQDVARLEQSQKSAAGLPFHLRVAFDPLYGYPAHYHRSETNFPVEVEWNVLKFQPLPADAPWSKDYPAQPPKPDN